jgi:hypothetical protein
MSSGVRAATPSTSPSMFGSGVRSLRLWVLLTAVIGGILGMHVLTGGDMTAGHGPLPTAHASQLHTADAPAPAGMDGMAGRADHRSAAAGVESVSAASAGAGGWLSDAAGGMTHGGMAACILFLVVGGATLLLALLTRRGSRPQGRVVMPGGGPGGGGVMRRGPPGPALPRLALCVYRI